MSFTSSKHKDRVLYPRGFKPESSRDQKGHTTLRKAPPTRSYRLEMALLFVFASIVFMVAVVGDYGMISRNQLNHRTDQLRQEIKQLEQHKQELIQQVDALRHNPEYIEFMARKELGMVRSNEIIYLNGSDSAGELAPIPAAHSNP